MLQNARGPIGDIGPTGPTGATLRLDGVSIDIDRALKTLSETNNLHLKKLSFVNCRKASDFAILNVISDIKFSLRALAVRDGNIILNGTESIANFITGSALQKLTLSNCPMDFCAQVTICDSIVQSPIRKLKLRNRHIQQNEAQSIVKALENMQLVKLSFVDCSFQHAALTLILDAIANSALRTLKLMGVLDINDEEIVALTACIEKSRLTKLSLRETNFIIYILPKIKMAALIVAIKKSTIQTLDVRHMALFNEATDVINIIKHSCVTKFKFDQFNFLDRDKIEIMDAIESNAAFRNISLARVTFTDQLFINVCDLIERSPVTHLDLHYCRLNNERLCTIIDFVKRSSISSLNLSGICFDDVGTSAICDLLENYNLQKININGIAHTMLLTILPSINKSTLTKFKRCLYARARDDNVSDDNMWADIKKYTTGRKYILKRGHKMKSARHI